MLTIWMCDVSMLLRLMSSMLRLMRIMQTFIISLFSLLLPLLFLRRLMQDLRTLSTFGLLLVWITRSASALRTSSTRPFSPFSLSSNITWSWELKIMALNFQLDVAIHWICTPVVSPGLLFKHFMYIVWMHIQRKVLLLDILKNLLVMQLWHRERVIR